jgi:dipeptide transport system substrate-binding protein
MPGHDGAAAGEPYDPEAAKQALAAAGAAGLATQILVLPAQRPYNPDPLRMAEMIRTDLEQAGVAAEVVSSTPEEFPALTLAADRNGAVLLGWVSDNGDPDNLLSPLLGCDAVGISNRAFWCNARFDSLVNEARATVDRAERARLYVEAGKIVVEEAPVVPLANALVTVAATDEVRGFVVDPFGRHSFESVDVAGGD